MPNIREWYERVNAEWPAGPLPRLDDDEAIRAARKLYRYGLRRTFEGPVVATSGNRATWVRRGTLYVNAGAGWHDLVHDLSHYCHQRLSLDKPHSKSHARLERRMIREVVRRGWLAGSLKAPAPAIEAPRPSPASIRYDRILAAVARWEAKERRAKVALRKLRARVAYYRRTLGPR